MEPANSELINWYENFLNPAMYEYFEAHTELDWVSTMLWTERKPNPLVVVGAQDEKDAGWSDFKQVIELKLSSAPCDVDLTIETQTIQDASAVHDSSQGDDDDASAVHDSN